MATPRKLLAAASIAVGLVGGGVAGVVLGVPGVSGAQTTTDPEPEAPTTTAPAPDQRNPDRPDHDRKNCPDKDSEGRGDARPDRPPVTGSSTNLAFREAPGGGRRL